ncbi:hypothetical protein DKX38_009265 [Salix brachista]|uniref:Sugar phosphate transporter domain-containing protein n=1 Tax=Salix brachista TaxID=2182728 RepID=A0A5N5M9Y4_9ROSI|nr:hypothetical protein DKX38_009265 [Salix brachista]
MFSDPTGGLKTCASVKHNLGWEVIDLEMILATSAISHVVLGQFKTCVVLLGNFCIFGSNPGATSICGAFMAIAGMSGYTYLNIHNPKPQTGKSSPRKSSTQSRLSKENGDSHDGYGGESV